MAWAKGAFGAFSKLSSQSASYWSAVKPSEAATVNDERRALVRQGLRRAEGAYFRLILVVGSAGAGKTATLKAAAEASAAASLNLGSALGARLLELSRRQRALDCARLLESILDETGADPVALDNLEILFDPALQQDVLRLLQGLSRNRTIVAAWPGEYVDGVLSHAESGHPEFVRYTNPEAVLVNLPPPGSHTP